MSNKYMTTAEVAERWNCTTMTVLQYIHAGQLSAVKLGRAWNIRSDEVLRFEKSKEKADMAEQAAMRVGWLPS